MRQEFTIWFTGLPSSGKSTLARLVEAEIRARGFRVMVLDGDEVRTWLTAGLGFSREDREENMRRIAHLAMFQNRSGVATITAAISPYQRARDDARRVIERFVEVYVECPLSVCEERDVKGLYKKARRGEVLHFTGVSDPYEVPAAPEVVVRTDRESKEECVARIMARVEEFGHLPRGHVQYEAIVPASLLDDGLGDNGAAVLSALARRDAARGPITAEQWEKFGERLRALGYLR
ncbi:MAG TPA: adenylyl-sulfate kinase [Candidatus Methylomirabilis sp.]|nr:adenylyl-sulfate kinase [Candidatus Methylomirabilis sp.]